MVIMVIAYNEVVDLELSDVHEPQNFVFDNYSTVITAKPTIGYA